MRATAATRLFDANVDEQLIKLKTGHTSDAVRLYKRVNDKKLADLTDIVACKKSALKLDCAAAAAECKPVVSDPVDVQCLAHNTPNNRQWHFHGPVTIHVLDAK